MQISSFALSWDWQSETWLDVCCTELHFNKLNRSYVYFNFCLPSHYFGLEVSQCPQSNEHSCHEALQGCSSDSSHTLASYMNKPEGRQRGEQRSKGRAAWQRRRGEIFVQCVKQEWRLSAARRTRRLCARFKIGALTEMQSDSRDLFKFHESQRRHSDKYAQRVSGKMIQRHRQDEQTNNARGLPLRCTCVTVCLTRIVGLPVSRSYCQSACCLTHTHPRI